MGKFEWPTEVAGLIAAADARAAVGSTSHRTVGLDALQNVRTRDVDLVALEKGDHFFLPADLTDAIHEQSVREGSVAKVRYINVPTWKVGVDGKPYGLTTKQFFPSCLTKRQRRVEFVNGVDERDGVRVTNDTVKAAGSSVQEYRKGASMAASLPYIMGKEHVVDDVTPCMYQNRYNNNAVETTNMLTVNIVEVPTYDMVKK